MNYLFLMYCFFNKRKINFWETDDWVCPPESVGGKHTNLLLHWWPIPALHRRRHTPPRGHVLLVLPWELDSHLEERWWCCEPLVRRHTHTHTTTHTHRGQPLTVVRVVSNDVVSSAPVPQQESGISGAWHDVTVSSDVGLGPGQTSHHIPVAENNLSQLSCSDQRRKVSVIIHLFFSEYCSLEYFKDKDEGQGKRPG